MLINMSARQLFDLGPHDGISDVSKVPRYKIMNSVRNDDGNVSSIFRSRVGNRPQIEQLLCEVRRILGRVEERDSFERRQTGAGGIFITGAGFGDSQPSPSSSSTGTSTSFGQTDVRSTFCWAISD